MSMLTVRLLWQTCFPPARVDNGAPMADPLSVVLMPPVATQATVQALWAVSVQPNWVLSPGLSAEATFLHPVIAHTSRHMSWAEKCGHVTRTFSSDLSLPCQAAGQLPHSPFQPLKLPIYPGGPPNWWRRFPGLGDLSSFTAPSQRRRSHLNSSSLFSLHPTQLCGDLSCSFGYMRSSGSFQ